MGKSARREFLKTGIFSAVSLGALGTPQSDEILGITNTQAKLRVTDLRCEYRENPLAVDVPRPRLSWIVVDADPEPLARGQIQSAYEVLVASTPDLLARGQADLWNTGRIDSDASTQLEYRGRPVRAGSTYYWKVRIWDGKGRPSPWSSQARWTTGLLEPRDWKAAWIGWQPTGAEGDGSASPWLRKTFELPSRPPRAVVYVNAAGYYELYLNGRKVGGDVLSPAVSDFRVRSLYVPYDIASLLTKGRNCIAVWIGRGWFTSPYAYANPPGPRVRVQCRIEQDGSSVEVLSDTTWKAALSPYTTVSPWKWNNYGGERYDARLENPQWSDPAYDDKSWAPAQVVPSPSPRAEAQSCPLNRIGKILPAVSAKELAKGRYELDFGMNLSGWMRLRIRGLKAGDKLLIYYADKHYSGPEAVETPAGTIPATHSDKIFESTQGKVRYQVMNQSDEFISAGRPEEVFCSKFNYHGFRYAILEGFPFKPSLSDAEALLIESDLQESGHFECSNDLFNRIHDLHLWGTRCLNLGGYMVDCPHRERLGYGDAQVSIETSIMNRWMPAFYTKWTKDWIHAQDPKTGKIPNTAPDWGGGGGPAWGGTLTALAWRMYLYYGDRRILEETYQPSRRYVEYLESRSTGDILRAFGDRWDFIGDWVAPGRGMDTDNWPSKRAAELFNNCYRVYLWEILQKTAAVLGLKDEVNRCRMRLDQIRAAIHEAFYDSKNRLYVIDEQAYQLMPLMTEVVPPADREGILERLDDEIRVGSREHFGTGMWGTYFLIHFLQENGRNDLLSKLISQETYPGWGYMLSQGATTIWEQWDGYWSQIHSCFTSGDSWFYQGLAGIRPDVSAAGFKRIVIRPTIPEEVSWAKASYNSIYGEIASAWRRQGQRLTIEVTIPVNTTATIYVPAKKTASINEGEGPAVSAPGLKFVRRENDMAVYVAGSGHYSFAVE